MATAKTKSPRATKAKMEALQAENVKLRKQVATLTQVNSDQLKRLVGAELLRAHVDELKAKLKGDE